MREKKRIYETALARMERAGFQTPEDMIAELALEVEDLKDEKKSITGERDRLKLELQKALGGKNGETAVTTPQVITKKGRPDETVIVITSRQRISFIDVNFEEEEKID